MRELTVKEILAATSGTLLMGNEEAKVSKVVTDSREAGAACAFAIKGERFDGHDFLGQVIGTGAKTVIVSNPAKAEFAKTETANAENAKEIKGANDTKDVNVILVDDTVRALQLLAKYYISTLPLKKKIAVTGSVGKTSTRDMLYYVASTKYRTGRNLKNFNNELGLPLTILNFDEDLEVAVLEMGMDSFGEIETLVDIARPDIAVITNIGISHIENLGSREGILKAKLEVTTYFDEDSILVVNQTCDLLQRENVAGKYKVITVGNDGKSDFVISNVCDFGDKGIKYTMDRNHNQYEVELPVPGAHNAVNASLAVAVGEVLGISVEDSVKGLKQAELTAKRLNVRGKDGIKVIDDTYNACPDSMRSAINTLAATKGIRKVAILGDMYELGPDSKKFHKEVGAYAGEKNIDLVVAIGEDSEQLAEGAREILGAERVYHYRTKDEFLQVADETVVPGDVVLVKASRGMEMEKIVKKIFKDKE